MMGMIMPGPTETCPPWVPSAGLVPWGGVAAGVTRGGVGTGADGAVRDRMDGFGRRLLTVYSGQDFGGGVAMMGASSLCQDAGSAIANDARYITGVVSELQRSLTIKYGD